MNAPVVLYHSCLSQTSWTELVVGLFEAGLTGPEFKLSFFVSTNLFLLVFISENAVETIGKNAECGR